MEKKNKGVKVKLVVGMTKCLSRTVCTAGMKILKKRLGAKHLLNPAFNDETATNPLTLGS